MRRNWSSTDLQSAAQAGLRFTAEQSQRMREEVLRWSAQEPEAGLQMEIRVHNSSAVSAETLARAEQETPRILERTGVATVWVECPRTRQEAIRNRACELPDAPWTLMLRLLSNSRVARRVDENTLGATYQPANGCGDVIMGRAIAHELGHLSPWLIGARCFLPGVQALERHNTTVISPSATIAPFRERRLAGISGLTLHHLFVQSDREKRRSVYEPLGHCLKSRLPVMWGKCPSSFFGHDGRDRTAAGRFTAPPVEMDLLRSNSGLKPTSVITILHS